MVGLVADVQRTGSRVPVVGKGNRGGGAGHRELQLEGEDTRELRVPRTLSQ